MFSLFIQRQLQIMVILFVTLFAHLKVQVEQY